MSRVGSASAAPAPAGPRSASFPSSLPVLSVLTPAICGAIMSPSSSPVHGHVVAVSIALPSVVIVYVILSIVFSSVSIVYVAISIAFSSVAVAYVTISVVCFITVPLLSLWSVSFS
jgi:hypothetical protein